ncbi:MAG TPA: cytochrome c biogenesis protein [Blastocatellia bacterium]|nr:cytochrome c biogenesis protein [Blastocatellia bacterium]
MELLWIVILAGYAICVAQSVLALTTRRPLMQRTSLVALGVAFGAHTAWLVIKGIRANRCPLVGTEEMSSFLSWSLVVSYLIASRWYRAAALKTFVFPIVLALATIAAISPDMQGGERAVNQPLQDVLLPVHVGLILLAYAAFFITFGAGLMYIIQERELKNKRFGTIFYRLPSLDTCDSIGSRSMAIGFVLLTLGILAGLWFTHARYGVYWQGGPLEIFSIATWVIYLLLIQTRVTAGWGGRTGALASIVSFLIVVCSLVGVRYLGHG